MPSAHAGGLEIARPRPSHGRRDGYGSKTPRWGPRRVAILLEDAVPVAPAKNPV